jgi:hypothetical protein
MFETVVLVGVILGFFQIRMDPKRNEDPGSPKFQKGAITEDGRNE